MYCTQNLGHKIEGAVFMSKILVNEKIQFFHVMYLIFTILKQPLLCFKFTKFWMLLDILSRYFQIIFFRFLEVLKLSEIIIYPDRKIFLQKFSSQVFFQDLHFVQTGLFFSLCQDYFLQAVTKVPLFPFFCWKFFRRQQFIRSSQVISRYF